MNTSEEKRLKENGFRSMNMEWKNGLNGAHGVRYLNWFQLMFSHHHRAKIIVWTEGGCVGSVYGKPSLRLCL